MGHKNVGFGLQIKCSLGSLHITMKYTHLEQLTMSPYVSNTHAPFSYTLQIPYPVCMVLLVSKFRML